MFEEICRRIQTCLSSLRNGSSKLFCIPVNDDGGKQVQSGNPEVLALCGLISDFALSTDPQGAFQGVVRLTFIETNIGTALQGTFAGGGENLRQGFWPAVFAGEVDVLPANPLPVIDT